jgi:hypothetical protein
MTFKEARSGCVVALASHYSTTRTTVSCRLRDHHGEAEED